MLQPRKIDVSPSTTSAQLVNAMRQPHAPNETNCVRVTVDSPETSGCMSRLLAATASMERPRSSLVALIVIVRPAAEPQGSAATPLAKKSYPLPVTTTTVGPATPAIRSSPAVGPPS